MGKGTFDWRLEICRRETAVGNVKATVFYPLLVESADVKLRKGPTIFTEKKSVYEWTCAVQTCVLQGSTVLGAPRTYGESNRLELKVSSIICLSGF